MGTKKITHVVSGPLSAGKSTYVRMLSKKLKLPMRLEFQSGVSVTEPAWWEILTETESVVTETHMSYDQVDSLDYSIGRDVILCMSRVIVPPSHIKLYFILPKSSVLKKRMMEDYPDPIDVPDNNELKKYLEWYTFMAKALKGEIVQ